MSCSNSSSRRRLAAGVSASGAPVQKMPWWTMHEVGAVLGGAFEELGAGRDAGHDGLDAVRSWDLKPVGSVVSNVAGRQQLVEVVQHVVKHAAQRYS